VERHPRFAIVRHIGRRKVPANEERDERSPTRLITLVAHSITHRMECRFGEVIDHDDRSGIINDLTSAPNLFAMILELVQSGGSIGTCSANSYLTNIGETYVIFLLFNSQ